MTGLDKLLRDLSRPGVEVEFAVLLGCLAVAFGVCWLLGRRHASDSIWFGRAIVDGLLFPLLALLLAYTARNVVDDYQAVPLLRIAVPVLVSLAGIRFLARVFTVVFPASGVARLAERLFSWLAWLGAVLWIVGAMPAVLEEMDSITLMFGKTRVSVLDIVGGVLSSGVVLVLSLWVSSALEKRILREAVDELLWFQTLLYTKLRRAVEGRIEDPELDEALGIPAYMSDWNGTAKLCLHIVERCTDAWATVAELMPDEAKEVSPMQELLLQIRTGLDREFPDAHKFIRAGWDAHLGSPTY